MFNPDSILTAPPSNDPSVVVAVIGWANDWAAYRSPEGTSVETCAREGNKISEREARSLFPELEKMYYRI